MFSNLVLSGGGIQGLAYIGLVKYLEETNNINKIEKFAGTSAGALGCLMIILGYTSSQMEELVINLDFKSFGEKEEVSLLSLVENYGISSGKKIDDLFKIIIKKKTGNPNITFKELFEKTNKELNILVSNLTKGKYEVFNHINTPDLSIYLAVRLSLNIPFLFKPIEYNSCLYVDGGVMNNFPIKIFNNELDKTIGFCFVKKEINNTIENFQDYLFCVLTSIYYAPSRLMADTYEQATCRLEIKYLSFDFSLDQNQKKEIIEEGYKQSNEFLTKRFNIEEKPIEEPK
jgi:NTE family protein